MKSKLPIYFLPVMFVIFLFYGYSLQDDPNLVDLSTEKSSQARDNNLPGTTTAIGDSCFGAGQEKHDDGSFESGYGWITTITDGRFVIKFKPTTYPWKYNKFCVGLTTLPAEADSMKFDIVIYDTTGAGGGPGNLLGTLTNQTARPILIFPTFSWFSYDIASVAGTLVNSGSVYIGIKFDAAAVGNTNKFVMADETAPLWPGYSWSIAGPWDPIQGTFVDYRCLAMRTMGATPSGGACNTIANTWVNRPVVPNACYFGASAWIGDTLYFQAPTSGGVGTTTMYRYTYGGAWTTGVPMPGPLVGGSMVNCNGKLYYIGGSPASITTGGTTVYEYTPSTGTWTTKAPLPVALSGHQAVSWGDSVIIVVGGPYTGSAANLAHHYYRPSSNTWGTTTNSLPAGQGRRTFGMAISGNKIVMSSGFNTLFLKSTYVGTIGSNGSIITWVSAPEVPTVHTGLSRPGSTAFGDYFFLVCGERGPSGGYYDTTHVFSVSSNSWVARITNIPFKRSNIMGHVTARCISDTVSLFCPAGYGNLTGSGLGAATDLFHITRTGILTSTGNLSSIVPEKYELSQNYPNPFNPTTKITFSIPKLSFVSLKVYDVAGKELKTLVNEIRGASTYTVEFDASNLSSGLYFYTLKTENFEQTKKMIVVK